MIRDIFTVIGVVATVSTLIQAVVWFSATRNKPKPSIPPRPYLDTRGHVELVGGHFDGRRVPVPYGQVLGILRVTEIPSGGVFSIWAPRFPLNGTDTAAVSDYQVDGLDAKLIEEVIA